MRIVIPYAAFLITAASGCSESDVPAPSCEAGDSAAHNGQYELAVEALSDCLALPQQSDSTRANALQARAWSYSNLGNAPAAVADQEAAFKLQQPTAYGEFINYATYLRRVGRTQESLYAVLSAEQIEAGAVSMMTQYQKGWSLLELGRNAEAVKAFTKGIPVQPDYPFVYWRRGLAYEGLGDKRLAKEDFEQCARLLDSKEKLDAAGAYLPAIRAKLREYGLDARYPL